MQTFSVQQLIATPTLLTQLRLTPGYRKPWERRSWGVNKVTINWYKVTWLLTTRVLIYQQGGEHLSLVNAILHCTFLVIVVSVSGSSTKPFHTKLYDANASVQIWVIIFGRTDKQSYGKLLTQLFSAKATMFMWVSKYKLAAYWNENKCHIFALISIRARQLHILTLVSYSCDTISFPSRPNACIDVHCRLYAAKIWETSACPSIAVHIALFIGTHTNFPHETHSPAIRTRTDNGS